jgi:hypothetical protein
MKESPLIASVHKKGEMVEEGSKWPMHLLLRRTCQVFSNWRA